MPVLDRLSGKNLQQVVAKAAVQNHGRPRAEQTQALGRTPAGRRRSRHDADVLAAAPNQEPMAPFDFIEQSREGAAGLGRGNPVQAAWGI